MGNLFKVLFLISTNFLSSVIIICILIQGYLVSRLFIYCGIVESINQFLLKKSRGSIHRLMFYLLVTSTFVSLFVVNTVCMLAFLPLLQLIKEDLSHNQQLTEKQSKHLSLIMTFLMMYSVNLGGLGVLTASGTHLLLIWFAFYHNIDYHLSINFFTWLMWGIPIIFILAFIVYFLCFLFIPKNLRNQYISFQIDQDQKKHEHESLATWVSIMSLILWFGLSLISQFFPRYNTWIALFFLIQTIFYLIWMFGIPISRAHSSEKKPLIPFAGLTTGIPQKGILIIIFIIILSYAFSFFHLDQALIHHFSFLENHSDHNLMIFFLLGFIAIFLSEILSNSATSIMMFTIALPFCHGIMGVPLLVALSLLATIPSMTPMASPGNALVLGSMQQSFNKTLVLIGFLMNLASLMVITLFSYYVIPWIISLHF